MTSVQFLPARTGELVDIRNWPPYPQAFRELDYALREQGWIDEFHNKPHVRFYIAKQAQQTLGFSLLATTAPMEAEFRIALHPEHLGKGIGRRLTLQTLAEGFVHRGLSRIHLIVRVNNTRAIRLYQSLGFMTRHKTTRTIMDASVEFWVMDINLSRYNKLNSAR